MSRRCKMRGSSRLSILAVAWALTCCLPLQSAAQMSCGGAQGVSCPAGFFCDFPVGTCGENGVAGVCVAITDPCVTIQPYIPVCGCGGNTYFIDAVRKCAGVSLDHEGVCESEISLGDLFVLNTAGTLWRVHSVTGTATNVAELGDAIGWMALATESEGSVLVLHSIDGLLRVDLSDGSHGVVAPGVTGDCGRGDVVVSRSGRVFITEWFCSGGALRSISEVDVATGEQGPIIANAGALRLAIHDDELYFSHGQGVSRVDLTNGCSFREPSYCLAELISNPPGDLGSSWLAMDPDGNLIVLKDSKLFRLNRATDSFELLDDDQTNGTGVAVDADGDIFVLRSAALERHPDPDFDSEPFPFNDLGAEIDFTATSVRTGECEDGVDNDGDGQIDVADSGCHSAADFSEKSLFVACDDGADNDGDGLIDYPSDPDCPSLVADSESPAASVPAFGMVHAVLLAVALLVSAVGPRRARSGR